MAPRGLTWASGLVMATLMMMRVVLGAALDTGIALDAAAAAPHGPHVNAAAAVAATVAASGEGDSSATADATATAATAAASTASLLEIKGFIASAAGAAAGQAMGGEVASVSDRENCVGCRFIWSKVNALLDQSSGYEAVKDAFERTCANMPDVFYDVCDVMFDREDEMIQMYLNNMEFKAMCDKMQICLN